jgi:signal transduction histidine kinase
VTTQALKHPRTFFAPPERLSPARIQNQSDALGDVSTLLDCMTDFAMILNEQRQIIFANRVLRDFTGSRIGGKLLDLRPGELLDCREAWLAPSGCGTGEACRTCGAVNAILGALAGRHVIQECRISTAVADAFDLRITASPFLWQDGKYALVIATDISNEKRREMLERIFFHDILNTAGSIQGMTELIRTDPASMEVFKDDLYETAETLVNEIRSQSLLLAAERKELAVTLAPQNSRRQLETVVQTYQHHSLAKAKTIVIAPASADFPFPTDEALLQRVLGNLLKNALEASQPGDSVELGAEEHPDRFVFWCHNAQAIPRAIQLQLFQRSFSTKGPGRGIGTYSIRLLTERYLGGTVVLSSEPETGTRFELSFPK